MSKGYKKDEIVTLARILKHYQTVEAAQLDPPRNNHRCQLVDSANRALH